MKRQENFFFLFQSSVAIGKMRANPTAQLKGFAEHFEKCIQNTTHYERLIPETDQNKR